MTELESLCKAFNVRVDFRFGEARRAPSWRAPNNWRVTLRMARRQLTVDFYGGAGITKPTAADVLYSLCLDAVGGEMSFEQFCTDFGYDETSQAAAELHALCVTQAEKVRNFLGDEFEHFASAEH
jgi:hypothetical protein